MQTEQRTTESLQNWGAGCDEHNDGENDVWNIDKLLKRERIKKLKDLWKQAFCRAVRGMGKDARKCDDQELGNWSLALTSQDKLFKEQMEVHFPEEYPLGSSFELIGFDKLQVYLRSELNRVFSMKDT